MRGYLAHYFNHKVVSIYAEQRYGNEDLAQHGSLNYRTRQFLLLAFFFSQHDSLKRLYSNFWALINPTQTDSVCKEDLVDFLKDCQTLAIDAAENCQY